MTATTPPPVVLPAVAAVLQPGEVVRWQGRPKQGLVFRKSDLTALPFALFWNGFILLWIALSVLFSSPWWFTVLGTPFLLVGIYMLFGRHVVDVRRRAQVVYAVTDRRVLILGGSTQSLTFQHAIDRLPDAQLERHRDGTATVWPKARFAYPLPKYGTEVRHRSLERPLVWSPDTLERIPDADAVLALIQSASGALTAKERDVGPSSSDADD